jgi:hypothetical protein
VLRDNGFATVWVSGARCLYSVAAAPPHEVDSWLNTFRVLWEPRLDALATEVARGKRRPAPVLTGLAAVVGGSGVLHLVVPRPYRRIVPAPLAPLR